MPDQALYRKHSVVGEDGELIQPDRTVDEDTYAEYVATYVHRDPLWFRIKEHIKEWRLLYSFLSLLLCCPAYVIIPSMFGQGMSGTQCLDILLITITLAVSCVIGYQALMRIDDRK